MLWQLFGKRRLCPRRSEPGRENGCRQNDYLTIHVVRPDKYRVRCPKCILPFASQFLCLFISDNACPWSRGNLPPPSFPHIHYFLPMDTPPQAVARVEEKGDSELAQNNASASTSGSGTDENMEKASPTSPIEPPPPPPELPEGGFWAWATVAGA
jgi:hypothetical protein